MQPDLPWNVAGIPPEAREAARAAARREGLSVGEWLTRRILRSLTEGGESGGWHRSPDTTIAAAAPIIAASPTSRRPPATPTTCWRGSPARENEAQGAYRRIEDQLKGMAKRLEVAEKQQSDSSKAMSDAATEINTATKEQAQAFDQLGTHVMGLGDRLTRVERSAAAEGVKDAVKGLHAGLSRLADQIAENTNQSASQIAKLAGNVESVAGKLNEVRSEAEQAARTLAARIASFDERWRTADGNSHAIAGKLDRTIAGITAFEERIRSAEGMSQAIADKLDRTIASMEAAARNARADDQAELQRQAASINQLSEALDKLATRITGSEAQTAGAMARLEQQIVESRQVDQPFDRRLQGIEQALGDIAGRLESAERSASTSARAVEENLRNVSTRLDAADKHHRDAIAELQAAAHGRAACRTYAAAGTASARCTDTAVRRRCLRSAAVSGFSRSPGLRAGRFAISRRFCLRRRRLEAMRPIRFCSTNRRRQRRPIPTSPPRAVRRKRQPPPMCSRACAASSADSPGAHRRLRKSKNRPGAARAICLSPAF